MTGPISTDTIRTLFSTAMSQMYQAEVPQYGTLLDLVRDVNRQTLSADPELAADLSAADELDRLSVERHGAIRLGTPQELSLIRRMFAVMGMYPVGYYDLSVAGIPVHSTAFRPVDPAALARNPFRVFTSLLRLDVIKDTALADKARTILNARRIITDRALALIETAETQKGLTDAQAREFVTEAIKTFAWHKDATVDAVTYDALVAAHRLIADVVSFKGPHINHLTPRTLDIDRVQAEMPRRGIDPKAVIEGPPRRAVPILLRQTSFKALQEDVMFDGVPGTHLARFGEIEQRGVALTPAGRALYDTTLARARADTTQPYQDALDTAFQAIPDDLDTLRRQGLAFVKYRAATGALPDAAISVDDLLQNGHLTADPQVYEDFLPVSAAGIFQSNLATEDQSNFAASANKDDFEHALGAKITDEMSLYAKTQQDSLEQALAALGQVHLIDKSAA